jgi:hypothetical protein
MSEAILRRLFALGSKSNKNRVLHILEVDWAVHNLPNSDLSSAGSEQSINSYLSIAYEIA